MNKREFKKLVVATGKRILNGTECIMLNTKIKTEKRKKRALIDLWNSTLQRTIDSIPDPLMKASVRAYYGTITETVMADIEIDDCYSLIMAWADELARGDVKA